MWYVDIVVNIEQVGPPILATEVFVRTDPSVPIRACTEFVEQSGIKTDHHRVGRC